MSEQLIKELEKIRLKSGRAFSKGVTNYNSKERRYDASELQKTLKNIGKDLGQTRLLNQLSNIVNNLVLELCKGDLEVDFQKITNLCDTLARNL